MGLILQGIKGLREVISDWLVAAEGQQLPLRTSGQINFKIHDPEDFNMHFIGFEKMDTK